jgi:hypothetical protein
MMVNIEAALGSGLAEAVPRAVRTEAVHTTELVYIEAAPGPGPGHNTVAVPGAVRTEAVRTEAVRTEAVRTGAAVLEVVRTGGGIPGAVHTGGLSVRLRVRVLGISLGLRIS